MSETERLPGLLRLPAELLQDIFSYLQPLELAIAAQVCKGLYNHSYDDQIWQPLVTRELPSSLSVPSPLKSFRELYTAHHPHWFLTRHRIWFADAHPNGKLLVCRYNPNSGGIEAHTVVATRPLPTLQTWEKDRDVVIHSFEPSISLDTNQAVLKLSVDNPKRQDHVNSYPSDRGYAPSSRYSKEVLMDTFSEAGLYASFMLCRALPEVAISESTKVWPPLRLPAGARARNETRDSFNSIGHRPTKLSEVSQHNFRLRKWVEYTGRERNPRIMHYLSPNGLAAVLGLEGPYFAAGMTATSRGGIDIRMPEDITTYGTLPESCYTPTPQKPWQGIWCGDYSGHGCEFLLIQQPDRGQERPFPQGMTWLQQWFNGGRSASENSDNSFTSAQEHMGNVDVVSEQAVESESSDNGEADDRPSVARASAVSGGSSGTASAHVTDYPDAPTGRLEAIKITGDINVPRGEYTFIAPDIGHGGFVRVADEEVFRGARVVRSAGHIALRGFEDGKI